VKKYLGGLLTEVEDRVKSEVSQEAIATVIAKEKKVSSSLTIW
jgi:hypothetical protein